MDIVYLPATEPEDATYGFPPSQIVGRSDLVFHEVRFGHMVWYNEQIRAEALEQIAALNLDRLVLVGFSKSGLGAWHLTRALGDRVEATIIFDAPFAHEAIPTQWGAGPFYSDVETWREELPIRRVTDLELQGHRGHRLILVSGVNFDADMVAMGDQLAEADCPHTLLRRPELTHHWSSGWLELALTEL
ncbi:MAG: hypothetical protein HN712_26685 [Gemmatimonadetes bacterium]|jgi:pimeloyl-ACP methyl ester carboxylesterase|nr:hypothetical protein [Gemmatimonadota bacterium]MBT6144634.1 hypothetical protein [Gemmatimonadota bacterium]MBT7863928.1 hypothetical protein [Gemmatimonadota bacterium]